MGCEKSVVVMKCGGCDFVKPNKKFGLITKRFDINDMVNKIIFLIENKKSADEISKNSRKYILDNFSIEKVALKIYGSFIK